MSDGQPATDRVERSGELRLKLKLKVKLKLSSERQSGARVGPEWCREGTHSCCCCCCCCCVIRHLFAFHSRLPGQIRLSGSPSVKPLAICLALYSICLAISLTLCLSVSFSLSVAPGQLAGWLAGLLSGHLANCNFSINSNHLSLTQIAFKLHTQLGTRQPGCARVCECVLGEVCNCCCCCAATAATDDVLSGNSQIQPNKHKQNRDQRPTLAAWNALTK